jgi:hypothetical protein
LADWLRERADLGRPAGSARSAGTRPPADVVARDPRMEPWLDPKVVWGPTRRTTFGKDTALLVTGSSPDGPALVFERRLVELAQGLGTSGLVEAVRAGPSAAAALRLNATVSNGPICAALVRLPPDVRGAVKGTLKTEPGVVILAFRAPDRWDYVTFWFPDGLDLTALARETAPPPQVLKPLGPEAERSLVPTLALGGEGATRGSKTILCRSQGPAGAAIDRVATSLLHRGWRDAEAHVEEKTPGARVLTGPSGTVWMATTDGERTDGLVTVLVEAP